ncbi:MAG: LysE family transporter [Aggregatilineales bacterium]
MFVLLASGAGLGLSAGLLPGPLQTYLIQATLAYGWRRSIVAVLSPLIADVPVILLMVVLLAQFPPIAMRVLQLVGGVFVWYLAYGTLRQLRSGRLFQPEAGEALRPRELLGRTVLVNWLSPGPWIFWSTVNGPLLVGALQDSVLHGIGFLAAFYGVFLGMLTLLILIFDRVRRIDPRLTRALLWVTMVALVILGAGLMLAALRP